jgi:hypothetical protein
MNLIDLVLRMNQELSHPLKFSYFGKFSPLPSFLPDLDLPLFNIPKIDQLEGFDKIFSQNFLILTQDWVWPCAKKH